MSHLTPRSLPLTSYGRSTSRPRPEAVMWMFGGALAAGLGLGTLTVLVLPLWTASPYPDSGADGALHIAADLWLLAHGGHLLRTGSLTGAPMPVALTPLLLAVLPGWLLFRACLQALAEDEERSALRDGGPDGEPAPTSVGWVLVGYLLVGAVTVVYASGGRVRADVPSAALWLPLFALAVGALAVWAGTGSAASAPASRPSPPRPPSPSAAPSAPASPDPSAAPPPAAVPDPSAVPPPAAVPAVPVDVAHSPASGQAAESAAEGARPVGEGSGPSAERARPRPALAAFAGAGALCAGGLVLTLCSLVWHWHAVLASFPQLTGAWSGRFAVLLLVLALLPNAAVWSAAYGLGPGFSLTTGVGVGPLVAAPGAAHSLPPFPLLAAVPDGGSAGPALWLLAGAVPVAAGLVMSRSLGRTAVPVRGGRAEAAGWRETVRAAGYAACGCGALMALFSEFAGGALGTDALARFGPSGWLTGGAALVWTAVVTAPGALAVRAWRLREPPVCEGDADWLGVGAEWYDASARRTRWAALKAASGGLMPDFDPHHD